MGDDLTKQLVPIVGAGFFALLVAWWSWQLQQGNRRRRTRRELREELELLPLLKAHPDTEARLKRRIQVLVDQYEPDPDQVRYRRARMLLSAGALLGFVVVFWWFFGAIFEGNMPWWMGFAIGVNSAAIVALINWAADRSRDTRAQDRAATGTASGTLHRKGTAEGHRPPDAEPEQPIAPAPTPRSGRAARRQGSRGRGGRGQGSAG